MSEPTKDRPILFSAPMVRAILDGSKTQTRRVVKPLPLRLSAGTFPLETDIEGLMSPAMLARHPYGQPGDRLWVRETFSTHDLPPDEVYYRATIIEDGLTPQEACETRWRPSIHMPRWASRITLEIKSVRIERLNDISEPAAIAEGVSSNCPVGYIPAHQASPHTYCFSQLWDSAYGQGAWAGNPFVWVIEFEKVTAP